MSGDAPLGPIIDTTPAERPGPVTLEGRFCRIEKLDPARHGDGLWHSFNGHDRLWTYMAYGPFADGSTFANWLDERAVMLDPYSYVVCDRARGHPLGIVTYLEIRPAMRVIEMGNIVYSPGLQRSPAATEAQYLLARYVFEDLGYRRYEWKCNALNEPSRRAAARLGFTYEGTFRQHMIVKGRNRDTAWFAMLDTDWSGRKAAFERWLDPANFDSRGRQHLSLSALNTEGQGS
ncbi:MAG TPA: GNAT family protein [Bauldia sp.]|nr:GNAT family protein [Bauldia sp.]